MVDRNQILSAVERYVASRGAKVQDDVASAVVDRFLSKRAAPAPAVAAAPVATPVGPLGIDIAPFVCEDDVRQAMRKGQKIHIGPRTILTPSARDLGAQYDILVMTDRAPAGPLKSNTE